MSVKFKISAKKVEFKDLLEFIEGHVRAMLDPTFGDIQNLTKTNVNPKQQRASGKCSSGRSSIATTVALMSEVKQNSDTNRSQRIWHWKVPVYFVLMTIHWRHVKCSSTSSTIRK